MRGNGITSRGACATTPSCQTRDCAIVALGGVPTPNMRLQRGGGGDPLTFRRVGEAMVYLLWRIHVTGQDLHQCVSPCGISGSTQMRAFRCVGWHNVGRRRRNVRGVSRFVLSPALTTRVRCSAVATADARRYAAKYPRLKSRLPSVWLGHPAHHGRRRLCTGLCPARLNMRGWLGRVRFPVLMTSRPEIPGEMRSGALVTIHRIA
jgi:hypothetical protein